MTPERALTISRALAFNWEQDDESLSNLADRIRDAILQACAEERADMLKNEFICARCQLRQDSTRETKHDF